MKFLKNNISEILAILGSFFISLATFLINVIAGIYVTGIILIIFSIILCFPKKK